MAEAITIARPYAQAAFDQACKLGDLKGWSEMLQTAAEAVLNPEVHAAITSPRVIHSQLENLMLALCGNKLGIPGQNFIKLLVESQRLGVLPEIAAAFEVMRAEAEKSVDVVVTSAFDLSEAQKQKIAAAMKIRMGREIRLSCETNQELLGGIVIRAGDKVIDGSARTKLSELANALA
ncbi:MAG: F0F1 ATP synthase subunit delta [Nitrosomonadales bacterium]|nr:F0F1 ATP synthase subunit delta [Nitrosomonadales bacterium]